jgi:hypothetical protein
MGRLIGSLAPSEARPVRQALPCAPLMHQPVGRTEPALNGSPAGPASALEAHHPFWEPGSWR